MATANSTADDPSHLELFYHSVAIVNNGLGEDAPPLMCPGDRSVLIGVFDGLGGAGGRPFVWLDGTERTEASAASLIASNAARRYFLQQHRLSTRLSNPSADATRLKRAISQKLKTASSNSTDGNTRIKGSLVKKLPTTMALAHLYEIDFHSIECTTFWAGDSRSYVLSPTAGLQQLTRDDLRSKLDAYENLFDDSPMSNYVNASQDFSVHHYQLTLTPPLVVVCATDGCFGYLPSPPDFELVLLETMEIATSLEEWQVNLIVGIGRVTGDDATMAMAGYGWASFEQLRHSFQNRLSELRIQAREATERSLEGSGESLSSGQWWQLYKDLYEDKMIPEEGGHV